MRRREGEEEGGRVGGKEGGWEGRRVRRKEGAWVEGRGESE